ncbi:MAG TPA: sigma 54-interacting transcriptional regulator [Candidatus Binatia bacterium]|jgi:DNA-binding NtrC family response regulator
MVPEVQAKFLRVLEENQVRRIGAADAVPVLERVVTATSHAPTQAVRDGKLRSDLFYRLSVFHLELPPLRERGDDIALLTRYFLEQFAEKYGRPVLPWTPDFASALKEHSWPGNVRERRNAMEQLAVLAPGPALTGGGLMPLCLGPAPKKSDDIAPVTLADAERQAIESALAATAGNKAQAARILGITSKTLHTKLALYRSSGEADHRAAAPSRASA